MAKWAALTCPVSGEHEFQFTSTRPVEAKTTDGIFQALTTYIEHCCLPSELPLKAAQTITRIGNFRATVAPHPGAQMSFATSVKNLFDKFGQGKEYSDILHWFSRMPLFNTHHPGAVRWLDDISLFIKLSMSV
jgi:hypothetical protein